MGPNTRHCSSSHVQINQGCAATPGERYFLPPHDGRNSPRRNPEQKPRGRSGLKQANDANEMMC